MNFILEMYAIDNPDKLKFTRPQDTQEMKNKTNVLEGWSTRLMGKAKQALLNRISFKVPEQYLPPKPPVEYAPPEKKS